MLLVSVGTKMKYAYMRKGFDLSIKYSKIGGLKLYRFALRIIILFKNKFLGIPQSK